MDILFLFRFYTHILHTPHTTHYTPTVSLIPSSSFYFPHPTHYPHHLPTQFGIFATISLPAFVSSCTPTLLFGQTFSHPIDWLLFLPSIPFTRGLCGLWMDSLAFCFWDILDCFNTAPPHYHYWCILAFAPKFWLLAGGWTFPPPPPHITCLCPTDTFLILVVGTLPPALQRFAFLPPPHGDGRYFTGICYLLPCLVVRDYHAQPP